MIVRGPSAWTHSSRDAVAPATDLGQTIGDRRWMGGAYPSFPLPTESHFMSISLFTTSSGVFVRLLTNLDAIMGKAEAYAAERKFNPDHFVAMRLAPDMHN